MRIPLEEALKIIEDKIVPLEPRELSIYDAVGQILDEDIIGNHSQPPFNRSPYDGYALIAGDSVGASEASPVQLKIVGKSLAGEPSNVKLQQGEAVRIMTGGEIPESADCVLMQEKTSRDGDTLLIFEELNSYDNFIFKGEDYHRGDVLLERGHLIDASVASVIASVGKSTVRAVPHPQIGVLSTGTELQELEKPLAPGQIYNTNSKYICAQLKIQGLPFTDYGQELDHKDRLKEKIKRAAEEVDFFITTGGVSVGDSDYLPEICEELGAEIYFHGVHMKPGMPALFAKYRGMYILACSGNPFAAVVNFEVLGREIISRLSENPWLKMPRTAAILKNGYPKGRPVPRYVKVHLENGMAVATKDQGNGQIRSLVDTNALAYLPEGAQPLEAGTEVECYLI